jgi:hypothetical protein
MMEEETKVTGEDTKDKSYYSAVSFTELEEQRSALEAAVQMQYDLEDFIMLLSNIMMSELPDKPMAIRQLADEFARRVDITVQNIETKELNPTLLGRVKEVLGIAPRTKEKSNPSRRSMLIFKDDTGTYYWLARYSNNLQDREKEIISSESHQRFVTLVKEGYIDPPDLWFWHRPEWKWGTGLGVMYDDKGFAVAYGTVDKGCEAMAEAISALPDNELLVSHGMPVWSVSYDKEDEGVIVEHVTREVSPLPHWAAANPYTGFYVLEDKPMAFSKEDKQRLTEQTGISADLLSQLEARNADQAKEAAEAGVISKEDDAAVEAAPEAPVAEETPVAEEPVAETEVVDAGEIVSEEPVQQDETLNALLVAMKSIQVLSEQVDTLTKEIAGLKQADEQKIVQKAASTPLASLTEALAQTVVGRDETRVDGRTSLGQMAPKETEVPPATKGSPFPWLNDMVSGGQNV